MGAPYPGPSSWRVLMRRGDVGEDVRAWRIVLEQDGYEVTGLPTHFTVSVHNATVAWQRARRLTPDGVVGPATKAALFKLPVRLPRPSFDPAAVRFVEAANWSRHVPAQPKDLIVLHTMEAAEASTTAENCARWFATQPPHSKETPGTSAHYCVDDDLVICCVRPELIAWHAPGANHNGIGIEHAGFARQTVAQWKDDYSTRMLGLSSELVAWLCRRFAIPVVYVSWKELQSGRVKGITTHNDVSIAFGKSNHSDPGPRFPMADYVQQVRAA